MATFWDTVKANSPPPQTRETDWRSIVISADPDWQRNSKRVVEYEFTARGPGKPEIHEGSIRVFWGLTDQRGGYGIPETPIVQVLVGTFASTTFAAVPDVSIDVIEQSYFPVNGPA